MELARRLFWNLTGRVQHAITFVFTYFLFSFHAGMLCFMLTTFGGR